MRGAIQQHQEGKKSPPPDLHVVCIFNYFILSQKAVLNNEPFSPHNVMKEEKHILLWRQDLLVYLSDHFERSNWCSIILLKSAGLNKLYLRKYQLIFDTLKIIKDVVVLYRKIILNNKNTAAVPICLFDLWYIWAF